ncbi:TDP-N-acetylfucosamine:lipid II N-acetylfucosaminyltransferase [Vreelandella populi]|uniref:TDP-N-acetylfucosamine:lipid II N-acetylfucosaminyltransferase n=1 Tax=Vreelandella populi TaxID=2498858 RepID=UPI00163B8807|nr:TDP-N-acetylfucosamine:lipid II N-acetylfucosaminyltransferase [Halomonas populi]
MVKNTPSSATQKRKPRLLWANPFCLLDTSSGASMTVRQMLLQLVVQGYEIQVLGATVFDNPKGMGKLKEQYPDLSAHHHQLIEAEDGPLTHKLVVSYSHNRNHFTTHEEGLWYSQYLYMLDSFKPDIVWFYGGQTLDMLIADEARDRGIPVAFYLANGNYKSPRWCRDVDLILTDSQATADMYRKTIGFVAKPVGKFIAPESFIAEHHERKRLLFVNPSWQKGVSVFVQLAEKLERERPDIELEVVEARADWPAVLRETTRNMGQQRSSLSNVTITANTSDMRAPYSRARVLVAPSLWWESSGRVLAEAMLNGIPALITNRGGMPEMVDNAGITFDFPDACYEEPYQHLLSDEELQPLVESVIRFFDDEAFYQEYMARALQVGKEKHHIDRATERLLAALSPLAQLRAGNKEFAITQKKHHRQRLTSRAIKPEFKVDNSLQQLISNKSVNKSGHEPQANRLWLTDDFTWQIKGKVVVLDNRASLIKNGLADQMSDTGAFGIVAFDPASEVKNAKQYEGSDTIQLFQHALLGDGQAATLHACVAPEMTSTLAPLPAEKLPKRHHLGAQPLAELPISTIALDSINGLDSLDWLILDELSDAMAVLENGKEALKDTLLIQARVPFQLTHEKQPSLAELQHWASRNGFRFYRMHNIQHYSHLPENLNAVSPCATEQESADVLFLPSYERMAALSDKDKTRLAFIMSTCFGAHDIAFELMADVSQEKALEFLEGQKLLPPKYSHTDASIIKNNIEPSGFEGVNLHIMIAEKFTAPFIKFVNEKMPESKDHYVIIGKPTSVYGIISNYNVEFINSNEGFSKLERYMAYAEKILFHGLWSENVYSLLEKYPNLYKKSYWFMWGGDFYYPENHSDVKKRVIKNIGFLLSSVEEDVEYVRNKYNAQGKHLCGRGYPSGIKGKSISKITKKKKNKILLGNSAFPTNNHIEAIRKISTCNLKGAEVYCPLSYGSEEYALKIQKIGNKAFGEQFIPMLNFMQPEDYEKFLEDIDIAVYNHTRQQAYTTILYLLDRGVKIYLNPESPIYKKLKKMGVLVFDINEFSFEALSYEQRRQNQRIVNGYASDVNVANFLKSFMIP